MKKKATIFTQREVEKILGHKKIAEWVFAAISKPPSHVGYTFRDMLKMMIVTYLNEKVGLAQRGVKLLLSRTSFCYELDTHDLTELTMQMFYPVGIMIQIEVSKFVLVLDDRISEVFPEKHKHLIW